MYRCFIFILYVACSNAALKRTLNTTSLECDCESVGPTGATLTEQERAWEKTEASKFLTGMITFNMTTCTTKSTCVWDNPSTPTMQPYCLTYMAANSSMVWRDCIAMDSSIIPPNMCIDLTPFGLPGSQRCTCNTGALCNTQIFTTLAPSTEISGSGEGEISFDSNPKKCPMVMKYKATGTTIDAKIHFFEGSVVTTAQDCALICWSSPKCNAAMTYKSVKGLQCLLTEQVFSCEDDDDKKTEVEVSSEMPLMITCIECDSD